MLAVLLLLHTFFVSIGCQNEAVETGTLLQKHDADFADRLRALNTDENERKAK